MKAMKASAYGNYKVLKLVEIPIPELRENEILIKVMASSATRADSMMLEGKPYFSRLFLGLKKPKHAIPGTGFSGIVTSVGKEVSRFKKGDPVFGETTLHFGANAEYLAIGEESIVLPKPDSLSHAEAAPVPDGLLTSFIFLKEIARIKAGQRILINGASGSLGIAAVQLAHYFGAEVTAVCSSANAGMVRSLGARYVIDYQKEDFTKSREQYDVIYDTVGKSTFSKARRTLSPRGIYMSPVLKLPLLFQMIKTSIWGGKKAKFSATGLRSDAELRTHLQALTELIKNNKIKTIIDRQYPLENLALAHQYIAKGHKKGNVVIINNF